jgi:hypothetical protein
MCAQDRRAKGNPSCRGGTGTYRHYACFQLRQNKGICRRRLFAVSVLFATACTYSV